MINEAALAALSRSTCGPAGRFRRPLYDTYSFARLPATLEHLLTGEADLQGRGLPADVLGYLAGPHRTVLLVLVDGFGWHLAQRYAARLPFLSRLLEQGRSSPLTAQFPSTTAAHMTTLHTGLAVGQSGVHEWYYYEPAVDAVIAPLLYTLAGWQEVESLRKFAVDPETLLPGPRLYQRWRQRGITSTVYQSARYAHSTFSQVMFAGASCHGYETLSAGLDRLVVDLLAEGEGRYYFFYIDAIDHGSHSYGLGAPAFDAAVQATFDALEKRLFQRVAGRLSDTLLVVSADHGQVAVDAQAPVYVNLAWPELPAMLRKNAAGEVIRFAGSPRDLFLYVRPECLDEVEQGLKEMLAGRAEVWRTAGLRQEGFFGPPPHDRLVPRLGDLVVLPYPGQAVFWFEEGRFWVRHKGSHGGLTPEEMDTGVYLLPL
jgi:hypothetical protein